MDDSFLVKKPPYSLKAKVKDTGKDRQEKDSADARTQKISKVTPCAAECVIVRNTLLPNAHKLKELGKAAPHHHYSPVGRTPMTSFWKEAGEQRRHQAPHLGRMVKSMNRPGQSS